MQTLPQYLQLQLRSFDVVDWVIAALLAISTCSAFVKGFITSLLALLGVCAGIAAAVVYTPLGVPVLLGWLGSPSQARLVSFLLILLTVYFLVALLGRLLRGVCRAIGLGFFDRVAGAVFGLARGALLLAAIAAPLEPYLAHSAEWRSSLLLPYLLQVSHGVFSVVPQHMRDRLTIWQRRPESDTHMNAPHADWHVNVAGLKN